MSVFRSSARAGLTGAGRIGRRVTNSARTFGLDRAAGPPVSSGAGSGVAVGEERRTPVVLCTWRRLDRLHKTLDQLAAQRDAAVELHIWNNNHDGRRKVDEIVARSEIPVFVTHSSRNIGGFGRFYLGRELAAHHPYLILIDDDLSFADTMVRDMLREAGPQQISSYWAFRFTSANDYGARVPASPGERVDYCGTGGMIADSSVFLGDELFTCPHRYWFVEDLWLSYYADHRLGWQLRKSAVQFKMDDDARDQFLLLWPTKAALLRHLVQRGWQVTASLAEQDGAV
jgi:hypothetical protein